MKVVTLSISDPSFNDTITSAPTEDVSISELDESSVEKNLNTKNYDEPIELNFERFSAAATFCFVGIFKYKC